MFVRVLLLVSGLWAGLAHAGLTLDGSRSSLHLVSTKNAAIAEVHHFTALNGSLSAQGDVRVDIQAESLVTHIDIRDQRMKEHLLEVAKFPVLSITAKVDMVAVNALAAGEQIQFEQTIAVTLHGAEKSYQLPLRVTRLADGAIQATTIAPLVVNLADFQLLAGVDQLKALAKLNSIATQIPVVASFTFKDSKPR
ncbi:YceI family protein [Simiduia agarivorans]|uniref:Lipid/polyisoprenoid-binding YceI-like domain-containing protein n=1 Tax=Simiduia agarivorans (strain DSM 21679 / JCM 13881 / BCRC 17597 / SA1) TaxID=1117647 RepID=K4KHS1_SIMAS|nr:YceI family protein [Simiduia agarivorans]AFU98576.1 hypothetical protein M5M_06905 [Simiduia agarivorans SA1 = DSM 21679]